VAAAATRRPLLQAMAGEDATQAACPAQPPGAGEPLAEAQPPLFVLSAYLALRRMEGRGRGWCAERAMAAGTMVLVEKPLVGILDVEWRSEDWAGCDGADTTALFLELGRCFSPGLGAALALLHPQPGFSAREEEDSASDDDEVRALAGKRVAVAQAWAAVEGLSEEEKERLRHVVRLNSLGFYTNSEQLCHHGNFTALTGSGIFALASGFNHSCDSNLARFSVGDVTVFVTNRPIAAGDELCISYIESELLSAPQSVRSQSLNRDFTCECNRCSAETGESFLPGGQRRYLLVDEQLQASLAFLPPERRVETVQDLLQGKLPAEEADEEDEEDEEARAEAGETGVLVILGKDSQELRVAQAVALMQMDKFADALLVWRRLAAFVCEHCPPFDEAIPVYAVQAALCALSLGDSGVAAQYAVAAAQAHRVACGAELFRWRYRAEVEGSTATEEAKQRFWELLPPATKAGTEAAAWHDVVASWAFASEEVPKAWEVM